MTPEIRPYVNGSSETNSLHLQVYRSPSNEAELLANTTWDILSPEEGKWTHRTIADKESVPSFDFALEKAKAFAVQRSIPVIFVENGAA